MMPSLTPLLCPVCHASLLRVDNSFKCPENHSFDLAKEGYLNLLLSHQRKSSHSGDDPAMVQARRRFFESGAFDPVFETLGAMIPADAQRLCDAGCGEGTFLGGLSRKKQGDFYGVDISKPAAKMAAKRYTSCQWLVANVMREIPLEKQSMDVVLSILAPRNPVEFARLLRPEGRLVLGVPGSKHLQSLRKMLMPRVDDFSVKADEAVQKCGNRFQEDYRKTVDYSLCLSRPQLSDLVRMTPLFWNTTQQARQNISDFSTLNVQVNLVFIVLKLNQ